MCLILKWRNRPDAPGRMATAKKLHAERNLHPARHIHILELQGPESLQNRIPDAASRLVATVVPNSNRRQYDRCGIQAISYSAWTLM